MADTIFSIQNLCVSVDGNPILRGVSFTMQQGELHVLMGPNGSGKTTLARAIMGDSSLIIDAGTILLSGEDMTHTGPDMRARKGLFLAFQNPVEVAGVGMMALARNARAAQEKPLGADTEATMHLTSLMERTGLPAHFLDRNVNEGYSGGEKKRSEMFQLLLFSPQVAIMDEIDSGLDQDGMMRIGDELRQFTKNGGALLVITHSAAMARALNPDRIYIMKEGCIKEYGQDALKHIEERGFESLHHE